MVLINEMSGQLDELPLAEQAENAIQHSGLVDMHRREKGERGQARVKNLEELVNACKNFEPEDSERQYYRNFWIRWPLMPVIVRRMKIRMQSS